MRRHLSRWHRRIGLTSLALLGWLAITGVLLNHSTALGLDRPIGAAWVARIYGIEASCTEAGWPLAGRPLIDCGDTVLLGDEPVPALTGPVRGALAWQDLLWIATQSGLLLLTPAGERVEWLNAELLPGRPLRLGLTADRLVLQTPAGIFSTDSDLLQWTSLTASDAIRWSTGTLLDDARLRRARTLAAVRQLSWTKLLQDLHSGRIIGLPGSLLADLGAASIIALAILGLVMSRRAERRRRPRAEAPADAGPGDTPNV